VEPLKDEGFRKYPIMVQGLMALRADLYE
jgi:hypothetical protein